MRRPVLLLLLLVAGASGCGGGGDRPTTTVAATDPATVTCRDFPSPDRETCEGSYFQCRDQTASIVDDLDVGRHPDPRTLSVRYARRYWKGWDDDARDAARTGCRSGLRR